MSGPEQARNEGVVAWNRTGRDPLRLARLARP